MRIATRSWSSSICSFAKTRHLTITTTMIKTSTITITITDKADVVAFLKRTLQQRTDTIHELTDRLEGMKVEQFCNSLICCIIASSCIHVSRIFGLYSLKIILNI